MFRLSCAFYLPYLLVTGFFSRRMRATFKNGAASLSSDESRWTPASSYNRSAVINCAVNSSMIGSSYTSSKADNSSSSLKRQSSKELNSASKRKTTPVTSRTTENLPIECPSQSVSQLDRDNNEADMTENEYMSRRNVTMPGDGGSSSDTMV